MISIRFMLLPAAIALTVVACSSHFSLLDQRRAAEAADVAAAQRLIATAPSDAQGLSAWLATQRERVKREREAAQAQYAQTEKMCWQRFRVNACLRDARLARRTTTDRLTQQELAMNELERKHRTAQRMKQLQQKQSDSSNE